MKSKQLANVLLKVFGFSVCVNALTRCVSTLFYTLEDVNSAGRHVTFILVTTVVAALIQAAIGLAIINLSQKIAGWMFKNDAE
jgi:hypothetical protein